MSAEEIDCIKVPNEAIRELKTLFTTTNPIWRRYRLIGEVNNQDITEEYADDNDLAKPCKRVINKNKKYENILQSKHDINWGMKGIQLKHYQAAWMIKYRYTPNIIEWDDEEEIYEKKTISHVCGHNNCIETQHMEQETLPYNKSRNRCHYFIKKYELKMRKKSHQVAEIEAGPLYVSDIPKGYKKAIAIQYRMKLTKDELKEIDEYECIHDPHCFINYHEIEITSNDA